MCLLYGIGYEMASRQAKFHLANLRDVNCHLEGAKRGPGTRPGPLEQPPAYAFIILAGTAFLFVGQILYMMPSFATMEMGIWGKSL